MVFPRHVVVFQPMGVRAEIEDGHQLRSAAISAGVEIRSLCGERVNCGKCRVIIQTGNFQLLGIKSSLENLSPMEAGERHYWDRRRQGLAAQGFDPDSFRLSCQARVHGDVVVMVPESSQAVQQVIRKTARTRSVEIRPFVRKLFVEMDKPSLSDPESDWERLKAALTKDEPFTRAPGDLPINFDLLTIDFPALQELRHVVRQGEWTLTVTVWAGSEVIRVESGYSETLVGLAVDIGTTTIAAYLCDLLTGEILSTADVMNPQVAYGEDIMSRISYAMDNPDGMSELHGSLIRSINILARRSCQDAGLNSEDIVSVVVVGNSTMHHLFLNLDLAPLGQAPYVPALKTSLDLHARDLGLTSLNPGAYVHLLPLIASFVGSDCVAVLLAEAPHEQDENWLIVDVGTNAELVLGNHQRLVCTSTPTGPVFEGAHMDYGMRAAEGAIERVEIDDRWKLPRFKVIGNPSWSDSASPGQVKAAGICGSGIIDAIAELYRTGIVQPDGLFTNEDLSALRRSGDAVEYILADSNQTVSGLEISISQEDVRQLQLAKAPLYVAARYLLSKLDLEKPDRILLAGGFGTHIDPCKALLVGMIPDCPIDRIIPVGNSAGDGARIALLNREKAKQALDLSRAIEKIELPTQLGFQDQFFLALHLPHMIDPFPNLDGIAPSREPDPIARRLFGSAIPGWENIKCNDPSHPTKSERKGYDKC